MVERLITKFGQSIICKGGGNLKTSIAIKLSKLVLNSSLNLVVKNAINSFIGIELFKLPPYLPWVNSQILFLAVHPMAKAMKLSKAFLNFYLNSTMNNIFDSFVPCIKSIIVALD